MSQKKKTTAQSKRPRKAPSNQTGGAAWGKKVAAAISGKMQSADMKKLILLNFPYIIAFYMVEKAAWLYRHCNGDTIVDRLMVLFMNFGLAYKSYLPSVHPFDLLVGLIGAAALKAVIYFKGKNAKKYRQGEEYGSARWGNAKDIEPFIDPVFENNVLLTQTERLMMSGRPKHPKYARNKNVIVIGGSGSGKTRFFVKPNLMQMPEKVSYVCTDPKGTIIIECGKMLSDAGYKIKVLNTINFKKSMHYNPFHYSHRLSGMIYCADCGSRMGFISPEARQSGKHYDSDSAFQCGNYRNQNNECVSHFIKTSALEAAILQAIKAVSQYVIENEAEFISQLKTVWNESKSKSANNGQQEIDEAKKRMAELDKLNDNFADCQTMQTEEHFKYGFTMGVLLMKEIYELPDFK